MLETKSQDSVNEFGIMTSFDKAQTAEKQIALSVSEMKSGIEEALETNKSEEVFAKQNISEENLYFCHYLTGGAAHLGIIVETAGLANIKPPRPLYRPRLPVEIVTSGKISEIQLERIIYAGQAHASTLPESNARAGISIGDGTGVGKTGTILGIILDNWFSGRKRTVWFSVKFDLIKAVKDEMARLGFRIPIQLINDYKPEEQITMSKGIVFCTYQSLIAKSKKGRRRIDQLTEWLGAEGLLIFDEGHRAKNFFSDERRGGRRNSGRREAPRLPRRLFVGDRGDRGSDSNTFVTSMFAQFIFRIFRTIHFSSNLAFGSNKFSHQHSLLQ